MLREVGNGVTVWIVLSKNGELKIYVPETLALKVLEWYHSSLSHPSEERTYATISQHFHWKGIKNDVKHFVRSCHTCQVYKRAHKQYGLLPLSSPETIPWNTVQVDLIDPWTMKRGKVELEFLALTAIDPVTCWPEFTMVTSKSSVVVANAFDTQWLCRYPRPRYVIHDNGSEFIGMEFQELLEDYGITSKPTTVKNPQANSIVERSHMVITNQLRTFDISRESPTVANF